MYFEPCTFLCGHLWKNYCVESSNQGSTESSLGRSLGENK